MFIFRFILVRLVVDPESIQGTLSMKQEYTQDVMPHPFIQSFTLRGDMYFWAVEGNWSTRTKLTCTPGERVILHTELRIKPRSSEAAMQPNAPQFHPIARYNIYCINNVKGINPLLQYGKGCTVGSE